MLPLLLHWKNLFCFNEFKTSTQFQNAKMVPHLVEAAANCNRYGCCFCCLFVQPYVGICCEKFMPLFPLQSFQSTDDGFRAQSLTHFPTLRSMWRDAGTFKSNLTGYERLPSAPCALAKSSQQHLQTEPKWLIYYDCISSIRHIVLVEDYLWNWRCVILFECGLIEVFSCIFFTLLLHRYDIMNFQLINGSYDYVPVGEWNNGSLTFTQNLQASPEGPVESVCSKPCPPGSYKVRIQPSRL